MSSKVVGCISCEELRCVDFLIGQGKVKTLTFKEKRNEITSPKPTPDLCIFQTTENMDMAQCKDNLYPNCNSSVFLRSCEEEVTKPIHGTTTGQLPSWLRGTLLRNGPGSIKVGSMRFEHVFDSSALLHSFIIAHGSAKYQCRFIRTNTFKKNRTANRIVVSEFGTKAVPDPCHTIFDRVAAFFKPNDKLSDNTMVSVYPFGDEIYSFTESPIIHRIDPKTLETMDRKDLTKSLAIVNHSAHPHVLPNGDVINIGLIVTKSGMRHVIVQFPYTKNGDMFENARIIASMQPRWKWHPSYMHSFGVTENYFVLIEQPMVISFYEVARNILFSKPFASSLNWYPEYETNIVLISRTNGTVVKRIRTETLFYFHIINAFQQDNKLIVDLCAYKNAKMLNGMYIKAIETVQSNAEYAEWFRGRPKRLEVSLDDDSMVQPKLLVDIGCETPRIHYDSYNGRPYRYFYAISSDVDANNPGAIIKVDTWTGYAKTWFETDCYASEPVFVPEPNALDEDAGVLLMALVWGSSECKIGLLVLDARTLKEIGRVVFETPSPSPKCLHGWFLQERL